MAADSKKQIMDLAYKQIEMYDWNLRFRKPGHGIYSNDNLPTPEAMKLAEPFIDKEYAEQLINRKLNEMADADCIEVYDTDAYPRAFVRGVIFEHIVREMLAVMEVKIESKS